MKWIDVEETPLPDEHNYFLVSDGKDLGLIERRATGPRKSHYSNKYICECYEGSEPDEIKYWKYAPETPEKEKESAEYDVDHLISDMEEINKTLLELKKDIQSIKKMHVNEQGFLSGPYEFQLKKE